VIKKILLIGPLSPPITGNSLANDMVIKGFCEKNNFRIDFINTQLEKFDNKLGKFTLEKCVFILKNYLKLYKLINKDIIYITPGQTFLGVLKYAPFIYLAKLLNKKVIIHIHGNYLIKQYSLLEGLKKKMFKNILNKADEGVVLSKTLTNNLRPFLDSKKIHQVPNFVEDYLIPTKNFNIKIPSLKIIFLSNLMKEKGVFDLLNALTLLKRRNVPFEAKIAGEIALNHRKHYDKFFGMNEISYLGVVSGQKKKDLLEWGNVFVLPTYYEMEGVPISILEAMATGNIIVTTKHAGIQDIVSDKNGFFVKTKSPEDIFEKLLFINKNFISLEKIIKHNLTMSKIYSEKNFIMNLKNIFLRE
jgi:glycosyltransferase involved in cell wall biosynthesis